MNDLSNAFPFQSSRCPLAMSKADPVRHCAADISAHPDPAGGIQAWGLNRKTAAILSKVLTCEDR